MTQKPGEYVIECLMKKFIRISHIKIEFFIKNDKEMSIRKFMKQSDDIEFQNLLLALSACSENSLPSLVKALLDWHVNKHSSGKTFRNTVQSLKTEKSRLPDVCVTSDMLASDKNNISSPNIVTDSIIEENDSADSMERKDLTVDFIFCQAVISVLKQLHLHPGNDEFVSTIINMAFKHFQHREDLISNLNHGLINEIADMYAEVVGVLTQSRFNLVHIKFTNELKVLRCKELVSQTHNSIISLLIGMKFFRVKMFPIEDFVECFNFLTELANFFLEVDDKKIKHALSGLLVEVLLPVAAVVKNEVNIPILKSFVDLLYNPCFDMCSKKKHFSALSPLVTCLLSVGQKQFFLNNWPVFMMTCLSQLKNRDPNIARVALESLFRLLWVYIVRIKGEKHTDTQSKLYSIVNSLFPRGSKTVVPRDASTNIFVKIIHFIAQEKLDFAMEVIFDLIGATRSQKVISPERMNIGLCAFLLIALSLQQREGEPPMPQKSNADSMSPATTVTVPNSPQPSVTSASTNAGSSNPSNADPASSSGPTSTSTASPQSSSLAGSTSTGAVNPPINSNPTGPVALRGATTNLCPNSRLLRLSHTKLQSQQQHHHQQATIGSRRKSSYTFMTLNDRNAASIGVSNYIIQVRKAFDTMLRLLDQQVIRTMLLTKQENVNKESDDVITAERKPKIDLLKTCISAIPRLLPGDMSKSDLVELLSRLSIHVDEELRMMAQQALISIIQEFPNWRYKTVQTFINFVQKEITDSSPVQIESSLKIIYYLINAWKNSLQSASKDSSQKSSKALDGTLLDDVEGLCVVMLCQYRSPIRRLCVHILREVKLLIGQIHLELTDDANSPLTGNTSNPCFSIDVMDRASPIVLNRCLPYLPVAEKSYLLSMTGSMDFMTLAERTSPVWGVVVSHPQTAQSSSVDDTTDYVNAGLLETVTGGGCNLWSEVLAIVCSQAFLLSSCRSALMKAWTVLMDRINHLSSSSTQSESASSQFHTQIAENRTSSILKSSSSSKKPLTTTEKEHCLILWKNYIMVASCIAPALSTNMTQTFNSKTLKSSPEQMSTSTDSSTAKNFQKPTSKELLKILVPLIKCESTDIINCVIDSLGHFNPASLRDLMEEMAPILREANEKKQENVRRRKRKDCLRLYLVKILEYLAEGATFDFSEENSNQIATIVDWLYNLKGYIQPNNEPIPAGSTGSSSDAAVYTLQETRLHFCLLIHNVIIHTPKHKRKNLFTEDFKKTFFAIITNWTGSFELVLQKLQKRSPAHPLLDYRPETEPDDLCFVSLMTMCSLVCCGPVFDQQAITEDGYIVPWIVNIVDSNIEKLTGLCEDTLALMLTFNGDTHTLLDVLIDYCYTGSNHVSKIVFLAIVRVFTEHPDYPCDYISMITLSIVFTSNINTQLRENALQLFQLLYHRFLTEPNMSYVDKNSKCKSSGPESVGADQVGTPLEFVGSRLRSDQIIYMTQEEISRELAETLPDLTLSMFSEMTQRTETAKNHTQTNLLSCMVPWIYNIELVDFLYCSAPNGGSNCSSPHNTSGYNNVSNRNSSHTHYFRVKQQRSSSPVNNNRLILVGSGWGSRQATELVLNNLFYLTVKFGQELYKDLEFMWSCLVKHRAENIPVIIHYLVLITSVAPNYLLPFAKQIVVFLCKEKPKKLIENLFYSLQTIDGLNCCVERTTCMPFFRIMGNGAGGVSNNFTEYQPQSRGKCGSMLSSSSMSSNVVAVDHQHHQHQQHHQQSMTSSNHHHHHTMDNKRLLNNSQQLPAARSLTLDGGLSAGTKAAGVATVRQRAEPVPPSGCGVFSAPGTLRLDCDNEVTSLNADDDKYATLRAKDIRKSSNRALVAALIPEKQQQQRSRPQVHPLPLPAYGGYCAPLLVGFPITEPCPSWTQNYKSGVVLMLFLDIVTNKSARLYWERDLELLLHCIVLGLDHKEMLVHDQCKLLLVRVLQILCSDREEWQIMSQLMTGSSLAEHAAHSPGLIQADPHHFKTPIRLENHEAEKSWRQHFQRFTPTPAPVLSVATEESLTNTDNDMRSQIARVDGSQYDGSGGSTAIPVSTSRNLQRTVSSYSVTSTDTLIPPSQARSQAVAQTPQIKAPLVVVKDAPPRPPPVVRATPVISIVSAPVSTANQTIDDNEEEEHNTQSNATMQLIELLCACRGRPVWLYEDVSPARYISVGVNQAAVQQQQQSGSNSELILLSSGASLQLLVTLVCGLIDPDNTLAIKWAQLALNTGVNCTHRHYASRSLQVFRALSVPFDGIKLSALFSRLLDTIGDPNDDVQCYVVELLLTIESAIRDIVPLTNSAGAASSDSDRRPVSLASSLLHHVFGGSLSASASAGMTVRSEQMNSGDSDVEETAQRLERQAVNTAEEDNNEEGDDELHRSTPNLKNSFPSPRTDNNSRQRGSSAFGDSCNKSSAYKRSSAILEVSGLKKATRMSPVLGKYHFNKRAVGQLTGDGVLGLLTNSSTERSALSRDERTDLICELFWLANILLESDMEHEYFAGTRCLQRLAPLCLLLLQSPVSGGGSQARSEDSELRQKLEKMVPRLQWGPHGFPGTLHLIIKGCLIKNLWPVTTSLLSELIGGVHSRLADPTQRLGFPFAVLTLLATVFEEDSPGSRSAAAHIAAAASIYGGTTACPLTSAAQANLAKVMHLYASGSFTKDRSQWSRCVVKYLLDGYADSSAVADLLGFMTRLLEEGPIQSRALVLQALGHMVQCLPSGAAEPGVCAALASLTELLTSRAYMTSGALWREASGILRLVVARSSSLALPSSRSLHNAAVLLSMPLVPLPEAEPPKLELPGRVLDYQFDVRQHTRSMHDDTELASGSGIVDDGSTASRRTKTKELLLQLINAFGTYGYSLGFPKSPSVIFSQSTETLEHQISLHSSSETASTNDISLAGDLRLDETSSIEQAQVIRDLDEYLDSQLKMNFLDLPDEKWEDEKKPAWGVRSQSITQYQELPSTGQENTLGFTSVVGTFSTSGTGQLRDSPGQRRQVVVSHSPAKTVPTRAPKSPMSKALGGPNYCISSPQMQRPDSGAGTSTSQLQSSIRPQSLMFTGGSPTGPSQDGTAMMTSLSPSSKQKAPLLSSSSVDQPQHSSTTPASKKIIISKAGKSATSPETSSRQQLQKRHHRSASSEDELEVDEEVDEEDEDDIDMWQTREREVWIQRPLLNAGGSMRGATTSSECEDDDADEEFHGLGEIGGGAGHTEWGFQRRLRNLSLERSSSNNYEKEIEFVWCDTLAKALGSSHSTATLAIPATAASEESAAESPTLPLPSSPNHSSGSNSGGGLANLWTKFPQLFEDCCSKCSVCINEANYYVSVVPELSSIGAQFVNIVKQIGSKLNTPLFFVGGNHFIESGRLLESHKLTLMQMQETYDKFCNHVDYSFEILDLLKRSTRISHNNPEHVKPDEKRVSLCRQLHKMMTQLLLLYQSHCRFLLELRDSLLQRASGASASETVTDSSQQLQPVSLLLEQRLQDRQRHTATTSHRGKPIRSQAELVTVERQLYSALQAHDVELALSIWASNRVSILMFSKSLETDQPWHFLLQTYCRCLSRERPDLLVLLPSGADSAARSSPIQAANLLAVDLVVISGAIAAVERGLQHLSSGSDHLSTFGPHPRRPSQHPSLPSVGSEAAVTLLDSDSSVV